MKEPAFHSSSLGRQTGHPSPTDGLYATRNLLPLIAQILLVAIFLWSGVNKMLHLADTQAYMAAFGMPLTGLFLPGHQMGLLRRPKKFGIGPSVSPNG
jgi:hypothetical protein